MQKLFVIGEEKMGRKRVFISYCHKDIHENWIDNLVAVLGQYGIDSIVDIYDLQLGQDLNYFMEQIKHVDNVIILMGKEYKEKANKRCGGVGIETQIISYDVYNNLEQTKCIPIVTYKDKEGNAYMPYYLEGRLYLDFSTDDLFEQNIETLIKQIKGMPKKDKPEVINMHVSNRIIEGYLEDLWDLEMQLGLYNGKHKDDKEQLEHLLNVTNSLTKDIINSIEVEKSKKPQLLERVEMDKIIIHNMLVKLEKTI